VWAESVRPAVTATPTKACSAWIVAAGLLQGALFVVLGLMYLGPSEGADECPAQSSMLSCEMDHHRNCTWDNSSETCRRKCCLDDNHRTDDYFVGISCICFFMCIEWLVCPSCHFLRNILHDGNAYQHVESVRKAPPSVRWHIQCYHYETRHYTETYTDDEGTEHTEDKTERVRRDTWAANYECACSDFHSSATIARLQLKRARRCRCSILLGGYFQSIPGYWHGLAHTTHLQQADGLRRHGVCRTLQRQKARVHPDEP
jgi:hypothetical protein